MADLITNERSRITPTGLPGGMTDADAVPAAGDDNEVSPAEQTQYDQFVTKAMKWMHSEKSQNKIMRALNQSGKEVYESVGRVAAMVAKRFADSSKASGEPFTPDVLFHGTADVIVPQLFELGAAAGFFTMADGSQEEAEQMEMALIEAARIYGEGMIEKQGGQDFSGEAEDFIARGVAQEVDDGTVSPAFHQQISNTNPKLREQLRSKVTGIAEPAPEPTRLRGGPGA